MLNLANSLTILRIFMTPVISILLVYKFWRLGLATFLLAGVTDAWTDSSLVRGPSEQSWG